MASLNTYAITYYGKFFLENIETECSIAANSLTTFIYFYCRYSSNRKDRIYFIHVDPFREGEYILLFSWNPCNVFMKQVTAFDYGYITIIIIIHKLDVLDLWL
jgi:hypothetical protein